MATVSKPPRSLPRPVTTTATEPQSAAAVETLDPFRPRLGDRIAFAVWVMCALFMASLLAYDAILGLFR